MPRGIGPRAIAMILPSPRLLKSHLPFQLLPPDMMKKRSRMVYVARNPKDLAVSFYNFHKWQPMLPTYSSWDEYFEDFMAGKCEFKNTCDLLCCTGEQFAATSGPFSRNHQCSLFLSDTIRAFLSKSCGTSFQ